MFFRPEKNNLPTLTVPDPDSYIHDLPLFREKPDGTGMSEKGWAVSITSGGGGSLSSSNPMSHASHVAHPDKSNKMKRNAIVSLCMVSPSYIDNQ